MGPVFSARFVLNAQFPRPHSALIIAMVFDRNVNCRRAASVSPLRFLLLCAWGLACAAWEAGTGGHVHGSCSEVRVRGPAWPSDQGPGWRGGPAEGLSEVL